MLRLAAFYYGRKQPDDGEKTLNSLLDRRAQFPQADLLVGDFHALDPQSGEGDGGLSSVANPEIAVGSRFTRSVWRSMLATLGRREEAIKAADAILAKDPKNQFARALKVQVLEQMGGTQEPERRGVAGNRPGQGRSHQRENSTAGWTGFLDERRIWTKH